MPDDGIQRRADLSNDERYRYWLGRHWDMTKADYVLFVMLNPSTADADVDDPTIRRCMGFARSWGHSGIQVVNLYGWRATDPASLALARDPVGPSNDRAIARAAVDASKIIAAWGAHRGPAVHDRALDVLQLLHRASRGPIACLGTTQNGSPRHPLYVNGDTTPALFHA